MSNSSWLNCTIEEHEEMVENSRDGVEEEEDSMKSELEFLEELRSNINSVIYDSPVVGALSELLDISVDIGARITTLKQRVDEVLKL